MVCIQCECTQYTCTQCHLYAFLFARSFACTHYFLVCTIACLHRMVCVQYLLYTVIIVICMFVCHISLYAILLVRNMLTVFVFRVERVTRMRPRNLLQRVSHRVKWTPVLNVRQISLIAWFCDRSVVRSLGRSRDRSLDHSIARSFDRSISRSLECSIAWWLDGSMTRWLVLSVALSFCRFVCRLLCRWVAWSLECSIGQLLDQSLAFHGNGRPLRRPPSVM